MGSDVVLEATSLIAGVVALLANKRLLSTVNQHVSFQMRSTNGLVITLVATVGLLSLMLLMHVCFQISLRLEGAIALNTFVIICRFHRLVTILIPNQSGSNVAGQLKASKVKLFQKKFSKSESSLSIRRQVPNYYSTLILCQTRNLVLIILLLHFEFKF